MKIALFLFAVLIIANIVAGDASALNLIGEIDFSFIFMSKILSIAIVVFIVVSMLIVLVHLFSEYAYPVAPNEEDSESVENDSIEEESETEI